MLLILLLEGRDRGTEDFYFKVSPEPKMETNYVVLSTDRQAER